MEVGRRRSRIEAYLGSPAPATVLALVADELKSSSALWKACAKAGTVLAFDVEKKLPAWVAKRFHERGVRAEPDAVAALIALVGENPRALETEVDKIATWADGEPVGEREVAALVAANADVPIYELTEAWAVRDTSRALGVSETLFEHESRPRRDTAARLAGSLGGHLGRLRTLKRLAAEGVGSKEAAAKLKLNPYYAGKLYRRRRASPRRSSTTPCCGSPSSTARSRGRAGSRPTSRSSARSST